MRKAILSIALALMLLVVFAVPTFALTSQDVTVTATPSYISIANDPATWSVGDVGVSTSARIVKNTTYYTNPLGATTVPVDPVVDGACRFTIDNTSTVAIDLTVNFIHFTGGDAMQNSDTGSAGVGTFGAYSYCSGMTTYATDKVIAENSGSGVLKDALGATTDIKWGLEITTQTDDWTSGDAMTSTVTITATAD